MASVYTAVVLDDASRADLLSCFGAGSRLGLSFQEEWIIKAHHMTIDTKPAAKAGVADLVGKEFTLEVKAFGLMMVGPGKGIVAVKVECAAPSKNAIKHITVAHADGVKPFQSNEITEWKEHVGEPIVLRGTVVEVEVETPAKK